jgi:hypothetical protein
MEYLYSDEGQLGWLKGYCHPIRFNDLAKNGKIPQDLLDKLPPAEGYAKAVFPTLDEQGEPTRKRSPRSGTASSAPTSVTVRICHRLPATCRGGSPFFICNSCT